MTQTSTHSKTVFSISASELKHKLDHEAVRLIDVRELNEYRRERIAEAENIPLSDFKPAQVLDPDDEPSEIILYCRSGNRSELAGRDLLRAGFTNVAHLKGGLLAWKAAGYPVQVDRKAPISLFRQIQIVAGTLVLTGTVLGAFVSPWWLILSGFVGAGLVFAGITNTCAMGMLLAKLPYNRQGANG